MARTTNSNFGGSFAVSFARSMCTAHQNGSLLTRPERRPWLAVLFLALVSLHTERAVSQQAPTEPAADKLPSVIYPVRDPNTGSRDDGPRVFAPQLAQPADGAAPVQCYPAEESWGYPGYWGYPGSGGHPGNWGRDSRFHFGPAGTVHVATGRRSLPVARVQFRAGGSRR
jgi:hypothetical protein